MAELSGASSGVELLETGEEGKKKSKFKALKNFFGKKKKKEPEDIQEEIWIKPRLSSGSISISSLIPAQESHTMEPRPTSSNMGTKALSHDSVFILETESERSASKLHPTMEIQRSRPFQVAAPRTLPRSLVVDMQEAMGGVTVSQCVPRSGLQVISSKITEYPSLRTCKPTISPPIIRADRTFVDVGKISIAEDAPQSPQKKSSPHHALTPKKSASESSSEPDQSQPSPKSSHQPSHFVASITTESCLDTSAARHKIALNPRKQKKKKNLPTAVKPKQEEIRLPPVSKEDNTATKPNEADEKEQGNDSTETPSQEQSNKSETHDKNTTDQASNIDAAMNYAMSVSNARRRRRRGRNEFEIKERSLKQSCQGYDLGNQISSSPTEKTAGERSSLPITIPQEEEKEEEEKEKEEEAAAAEEEAVAAAAAEEEEAEEEEETEEEEEDDDDDDDDDEEEEEDDDDDDEEDDDDDEEEEEDIDFEVKAAFASPSTPGGVVTSMVSEPPSPHEDGASGAKKREHEASLLPLVGRPPIQEKAIASGESEAQVGMHPSHSQSEDEEVSSLVVQNAQYKMQITMAMPSIFKEKPVRNIYKASPESASGMTSTTAEGNVSKKRLPPIGQSLGQSEAVFSSDSKSASEEERSSNEQLVPGLASPSKWKSKDYLKGFLKSASLGMELSSSDQQLSWEKPKAKETSESETSSEEQNSSEETTSGHDSQSLEDFEEFSESKSFMDSTSEEQLAAKSHFQDSQESEEKEVSTESSSYIEKYNSSEDFSTAEEEQPGAHRRHVICQSTHQEAALVPKSTPKQQRASVKQKSLIQQQASSMNISVRQSQSEGPVSPGRPKIEHQFSANPENIDAADWDAFRQPLPPRKLSKHQMRCKVEQEFSSSPEIKITEEVASPEALRHSQTEVSAGPEHTADVNKVLKPPRCLVVRPKVKKEVSLRKESAEFEEGVSEYFPPPKRHSHAQMRPHIQKHVSADSRSAVDVRPPSHQFQSRGKPQVQHQVSSFPESTAIVGASSVEPLSSKLHFQSVMKSEDHQNMPSESECVAIEKAISVGPLHSRYSSQTFIDPHGQQVFSESLSTDDATLMEPLPLSQPMMKNKYQPQMTQDSRSTWSNPVEQIPAKHTFPLQEDPKLKVLKDPDSAGAEGGISMQSVSPRHPSQPQLTAQFASSESVPAPWCLSMDPSLSRMHSQPLKGSIMKQPISAESASTAAKGSSAEELFQPWLDPPFKEKLPAGPESYTLGGDTPVKFRSRKYHSHPPMRPGLKGKVASGRERFSAEWSGFLGSLPPKSASQSWINPELEPQVSLNPKGVAMEESTYMKIQPFRSPSKSIIKQRVKKITSDFEKATIEGSISGKPQPPKYPALYSMRSKVQEMSSRLENAAAGEDIWKKIKHPKAPSQSFVKFMTQKVFAENPEIERATYVNSMTPHRISRALLKPKLEEITYNWGAYLKGDTPLKKLPTKHSLQPSWKPEGPQGVPPHSVSVLAKQGSSKSQPPSGKLSQEVSSVSVSFPKNGKNSEEQLPSKHPSQDVDVSELSTGFMYIPAELSEPEGHLFPSQPFQAFGNIECPQIFSSSTSVTSEGSISEKNTDSWPLPKGRDSPKKTKKSSHVPEDFNKSTPTSATKPGKFTTSIQKAPIAEEKVLPRDDNSSSSTTNKADVENVFGVRLRKIASQKSNSEKECKTEQSSKLTKLPSLPSTPVSFSVDKEQQMQKSVSQGFHGTSEEVNPTLSFAVKQQSKHRHEGMAKKEPVHKLAGKSPNQQSDQVTCEPAWITMAKQKHKNLLSYDPWRGPKPKSITESKAETQEPAHEEDVAATKISQSGDFPLTRPRHDKKAKMKLFKSPKSVAFEEQRLVRSATKEREAKRSASLPPRLQNAEEPVWFSMAKKKSKAWSHIADLMQ